MKQSICTLSFGTRRLKIFANINLIAVTGYLKTRSYIDKENIVRNIVEVIVEQVDYLGYTKRGVDKSEPIPKLDPDHKKQEEYQMIHDALCADEDLPF